MISNVDKLLLTPAQQAEVLRQKELYNTAAAAGDAAGMAAAHQRAEEVRAKAGYSGGEAGDQYQLLSAAYAPAAGGYEKLISDTLNSGMNAIAAGYQSRMAELDQQRKQLEAEGKAHQAGARSAVWNQHRLAADGLLTGGLSDSGIADAIIATALNQASANAYQAMLDAQNDLAENDGERAAAKSDALAEVAALQGEAADRRFDSLMQEDQQAFTKEKLGLDYYYRLAERQWLLENQ